MMKLKYASLYSSASPLYDASENGHHGIVETLLGHPNIDVNRGPYRTPLYAASQKGYAKVVELLLGHPKVYVNGITLEGTTALGIASYGGHAEVVKLLLRCPKTDTAKTSDLGRSWFANKTPLDYAKEKGFQDIIEALESRSDLMQLGSTC